MRRRGASAYRAAVRQPVRVLKACSELIDLRTTVPAPGARDEENTDG